MHALCQAEVEFGPNARTCTSKEFWLSPNAEIPTTGSAWMMASLVGGDKLDFTGRVRTTNCSHWNSPNVGTRGLAVTTTGVSLLESCDVPRLVTCCAPIQ